MPNPWALLRYAQSNSRVRGVFAIRAKLDISFSARLAREAVAMNPFIKAIGTVLALAAGTLGASLESFPLDPFGGPRVSNGSNGGGNETGNETAGNGTTGNSTWQGNATGNSTGNATGNSTAGNGTAPDGNQTGNATGNQTAGNHTAGNQTADAGNETAPDASPPPQSAACSFHLSESGRDVTPRHHEWEWRVTSDVQHLRVSFSSGAGVPAGLGGGPEVRLIDGIGRMVAQGSSSNGWLEVHLERGSDPLADGVWRLVYEGDDAFADYRIKVSLGCDP
jgi:hypothetical protein